MKNKLLLIFFSITCFNGIAFAAQSPASLTTHRFYLPKSAIDTDEILGAFPAADSAEYMADIEEVLNLQASRTGQDCARAASEEVPTVFTFYANNSGVLSTYEAVRLLKFFTKVSSDSNYFIRKLKNKWERPRPFLADDRVTPCIGREESFSYPSGHATLAMVFAVILEGLFPDRTARIEERALQLGMDRVLGGVHFPSDVEAGRVLGRKVAEELFGSDEFLEDYRDVKEDLHVVFWDKWF